MGLEQSNLPPKGQPISIDQKPPKSKLKTYRPLRGRFTHHRVQELMHNIFGEEETKKMQDAGVDKRMMFGTNPHYQALIMGEELVDLDGSVLVPKMPPSKAIGALVMPRLDEALDMAGEKDPSNQMSYSPDAAHGKLLHKYDEIVLGYASPTCSAHCRYCYRLDLFNKDTGKTSVRPEELRDYIRNYNTKLERNNGIDPETGNKRYPIRELLLSGGDPLVLPNFPLYRYMLAAGEAGVHVLRIGSKELAFRPERADAELEETFRMVHERFPQMHINLVVHFTHPDEFLERDENNNYIRNSDGPGYKWMDKSLEAIERLTGLSFVTLENQTPIISHVNDDSLSLRILHEELRRRSVKPKYIFQGREIEGHKAFSLPVETGWKLHNDAMKGLSDTSRSRFAMSTEWGKMEIVSLIDGIDLPEMDLKLLPKKIRVVLEGLLGDGLIMFKAHRSPHEARTQGDLVIAKRNPDALWISGYEDRILYDGRKESGDKYAGLLGLILKAISADRFSKFAIDRGIEETFVFDIINEIANSNEREDELEDEQEVVNG